VTWTPPDLPPGYGLRRSRATLAWAAVLAGIGAWFFLYSLASPDYTDESGTVRTIGAGGRLAGTLVFLIPAALLMLRKPREVYRLDRPELTGAQVQRELAAGQRARQAEDRAMQALDTAARQAAWAETSAKRSQELRQQIAEAKLAGLVERYAAEILATSGYLTFQEMVTEASAPGGGEVAKGRLRAELLTADIGYGLFEDLLLAKGLGFDRDILPHVVASEVESKEADEFRHALDERRPPHALQDYAKLFLEVYGAPWQPRLSVFRRVAAERGLEQVQDAGALGRAMAAAAKELELEALERRLSDAPPST
jgi:hypothetical protein